MSTPSRYRACARCLAPLPPDWPSRFCCRECAEWPKHRPPELAQILDQLDRRRAERQQANLELDTYEVKP